MAQSKNQLANLKRGNPETQFKPGREQAEISKKANEAKRQKRRRHKTLQETVLMISKLPMSELGIMKAKRSGIDIDSIDEYDLTGLTGVVLGQMRAAAAGNSQAAQVVSEWMDLATKHKKDQLEIEKLKAEIERLRSGQDGTDDDLVLQFIEGMKENDTPDAKAD